MAGWLLLCAVVHGCASQPEAWDPFKPFVYKTPIELHEPKLDVAGESTYGHVTFSLTQYGRVVVERVRDVPAGTTWSLDTLDTALGRLVMDHDRWEDHGPGVGLFPRLGVLARVDRRLSWGGFLKFARVLARNGVTRLYVDVRLQAPTEWYEVAWSWDLGPHREERRSGPTTRIEGLDGQAIWVGERRVAAPEELEAALLAEYRAARTKSADHVYGAIRASGHVPFDVVARVYAAHEAVGSDCAGVVLDQVTATPIRPTALWPDR